MRIKDLLPVVQSVAPALATALGGPLAGIATKTIADKLLGNPGADETEVAAAIQGATPEILAKLREIDREFQVRMRELDIDLDRISAQDRIDARSMAKSLGLLPQMLISLALHVAFAFTIYVVFVESFEFSDTQERIVMYLLGILSAGLVQSWNFFLGSSAGSAAKTEIIKMQK